MHASGTAASSIVNPLKVKDLALAKRQLRDFKDRLERTDSRLGKIALIAQLQKVYAPTLKEAPGAINAKKRIILKIKKTWFDARKPMRDLKDSQVVAVLLRSVGAQLEPTRCYVWTALIGNNTPF